MMTAKMWLLLILISMGILIGHILGTVLMAYLMAWRDNSANNRTNRPDKPNRQDAGTEAPERDAGDAENKRKE